MKTTKLLAILFLAIFIFTSCNKGFIDVPKGSYENGIFISGEGGSGGTGSISFVSEDYTITENLIYKKENNNAELGLYLQSLTFDENNAFIIVDNQNTISVVNKYNFLKEGDISVGLSKPRYMVTVGDKGYVTNWGSTENEEDDFIAIIDLNTYTFIEKIPVGNGPERIVEKNGKLYVSHKGAFTFNNIISVIDIASKTVEEITVKDNPDELFFNGNDLIVLSEGRVFYDDDDWTVVTGHTPASISTIDTSSMTITLEVEFKEGEHPSLMEVKDNFIYYSLGSDIYSMDIYSEILPTTELIKTEADYLYGLAVKGNEILTLNANFSDLSTLNVFNKQTKEKTQTKSVALGASKIYFQ